MKKLHGCYFLRSFGLSWVENRTFTASKTQNDVDPTNNWVEPVELKHTVINLYKGCLKGHTKYVTPFSIGPVGLPILKIGVEITDISNAREYAYHDAKSNETIRIQNFYN